MPKIGEIKRGAEVGKREIDRGIKKGNQTTSMAKQGTNTKACPGYARGIGL